MKNTFKKLAAAAMAFTILGTGTAITKTIVPHADNTLTASADVELRITTTSQWVSRYIEVVRIYVNGIYITSTTIDHTPSTYLV